MTSKEKIRLFLLLAAGLGAGFVNGFLGTGGGILLIFALAMAPNLDVRDRFAAVIAVILPLSLLSAVVYGGAADFSAASAYILPGMLGGVCGGLLLDRINVNWLKRLFAAMVIWAGVSFLK
ncbi:MAG: TSUP family transporter [Clostridia bacterium]|nr:TSUP family transporter [Clostridia bacterium]